MMKLYFVSSILLTLLIQTNAPFPDIEQLIKDNVMPWLRHNYSQIGAISNGLLDVTDIKNKILQWKTNKFSAFCPSNAAQIQNLLNIVCTTAQPSNTTARNACITCFSRVTALPEGPQELRGLSACATAYFTNTSYAVCATGVTALSTSALNVQPVGCYMGYCDFVQCLRRVNSNNLVICLATGYIGWTTYPVTYHISRITQCTRESRTGINITIDADNVKFFKNVTSCILAKARCGSYNPITGDVQTSGYFASGYRLSNALQLSANDDLRIIAFPANTAVLKSFCSVASNLSQTSWLTNVC